MMDHVEAESAPVPSERIQRVLAFASDEADGLGHGFVTCQHLLYALSRESKGIARAVLDGLGVSAEHLHDLLQEEAAPHDRLAAGHLDLADEARDSLDRAVAAAREWGHRVLDTEHLLHGMLITSTSADELLHTLHVTPAAVLAQLDHVRHAAPPPPVREGATHAYRLTLESAWVLSLAVDTARQMGASRVASLHLLAALIAIPGPVQEALGAEFGMTSDILMRRLGTGNPGHASRTRLPLAEDTQRILGSAIGEAWNRGHQAVEPLHIAMGLASSDQNAALDLLSEFGAGQAALIEVLERLMPPATLR